MLKFKDFSPEVLERPLFRRPKVGTMKELLADANDWIEKAGVKVINVETLLLPLDEKLIQLPFEENTDKLLFPSGSYGAVTRIQVVRVWYEDFS